MHVISSLTGSGGAEHGLVREISRFENDIEQKVVTLFPPNILGPQLEDAGIAVESLEFDSSSSGLNWLPAARRLRTLIESFRPDVIQSSLASGNLVAQLAARPVAVPVLSTITLSGDRQLMRSLQPGASSRRAALMRRVESRAARSSHVWFRSLTRDAASTTCHAMGLDPERVTVIPRGVPLPTGPNPERSKLGLPRDLPVLLNVGRQTAQKGHTDLIQAFVELRAEIDAHLVILGREGDGTKSLRGAIDRSGHGDSITVIAYTDSPYDYYRAADVFVFSSHMEGLGTAVLEAMACRVPVVAYDIPPVAEIARDEGLAILVTPNDPSGLATGARRLLQNPEESSEMADRARATVETRYSPAEISRRVEKRLRELASGVVS
jgi:glycosyltransferase involved in cell wall biosynthesis